MSWYNPLSWFGASNQAVAEIISEKRLEAIAPVISVSALGNYSPSARYGYDTGDKYSGGFGPTHLNLPDYWTLRARSAQLFERNLFARGLLRRLITNEVVMGLHLESIPNEALLGLAEESLADWSEEVENRFTLWGSDPFLCDVGEQQTFGALQAVTRMEALVAGDVLVTLNVSGNVRIPRIKLYPGDAVQTPLLSETSLKNGNRIEHGVELDAAGRHIAFHVRQRDGSFRRLPAWGEKSGRRLAWLVYGGERRVGEVRGRPLLAMILQSLNELDRYRDAELRKAYINSILSMWVEKTQPLAASNALDLAATAGAVEFGDIPTSEAVSGAREFKAMEFIPGLVVEQLQMGEKIHAHSANQVVAGYGEFESAVLNGMAWALEIPPEILKLSFDKSFAASRAAEINFSMYLSKARTNFGAQFCTPVYVEWLLSETLAGNVRAPGLLESWRDPSRYVTFGAYTAADWSGSVKPSVDPAKQAAAYETLIAMGLISRDRASRELTGMKFSRVVKQLRRENEALATANEPLAALEAKPAPVDPKLRSVKDDEDEDDDSAPPKKESA